jgi:hypothetical protein
MTTREEERQAERAARNERVPFNWRLVKVEQSSMCDASWLAENKVKECGVFYLYDANRHVHICSFTPNYECWPVAAYAIGTSDDLSEEEREALANVEMEVMASEEACAYFDVSDVDRMPGQPVTIAPDREEGEDAETYYKRAVEEMREQFQGNPPWFDAEPAK